MTDWLNRLSPFQLLLLALGVLVGLGIVAAILGGLFVRRGMRAPVVVRGMNALTERALDLVKRPLTVAVLDEVADVIQAGHYTRNISAALLENHDELKELITEKVREDPNVRIIGRLPGYNTVVSEVSETTLRVLIEMLGDPRMDELVSDLLRNNLQQIKQAVRDRQHENLPGTKTPDPVPPGAPRRAG